MLDNEFHILRNTKASLVSTVCPKFLGHATEEETLRSLTELRELLRTLGIKTGYQYVQNRKEIESATILGSGKLKEISEQAKEEGSELLAFDFELTSSQIRNIRNITGLAVVDRIHIILEIFAHHAHTKDAKIQIEIAQLQYILPRLTGFWTHLDRQKGGVGLKTGEGEKQIELDRRIIRNKIESLKKELKLVIKSRKQQNKKRKNQVISAAFVGYTNAGKSSLINRVCNVNLLEEDKLFSTLDTTVRTLTNDTTPPILLIDTVGFISNLPNTLIEGFKTTLESAIESDLLLIVCDISDPNYKKHLKVTEDVLKTLGAGKKDRFIIFNKKDLLNDRIQSKIIKRIHPKSLVVSSHNPENMKMLKKHITQYFIKQQTQYNLFIPYSEGNAHSIVASKCNIIKNKNCEDGILYTIKIPSSIFNQLNLSQYLTPELESKSDSDSNSDSDNTNLNS